MVQVFGQPQTSGSQFEDWFCAANFLGYGNALRVVRPTIAGLLNATATSGNGLLIRSTDHYTNTYSGGVYGSVGPWARKDCWIRGVTVLKFLRVTLRQLRTNKCNNIRCGKVQDRQ